MNHWPVDYNDIMSTITKFCTVIVQKYTLLFHKTWLTIDCVINIFRNSRNKIQIKPKNSQSIYPKIYHPKTNYNHISKISPSCVVIERWKTFLSVFLFALAVLFISKLTFTFIFNEKPYILCYYLAKYLIARLIFTKTKIIKSQEVQYY